MSLIAAAVPTGQWDAPALLDDRQEISWTRLDELLNRATNLLLSRRLGAGRVAVYAHNSAETVVGYLSGLLAGASTVPINCHLTEEEVAYILRDSGTRVLLVGPENAEVGVRAAAEVGGITVIGWRCRGHAGVQPWEDLLAASSPAEPPVDVRPRPHLHYTSGTTGRPKAVETPVALWPDGATTEAFATAVLSKSLAQPGDRALVVSPMYHTAGLGLVRAVLGGVALVIPDRFDPEATLAAIERFRPTSITMVPTHFVRLLALPPEVRSRHDLSSLRLVAHTGASCPVDVKRRMIEWLGPVLLERYGGTESGALTSIDSEEWLEHPGSVGRVLPPFEVVVVRDDAEVGPRIVGELYFRDGTGRGITYHDDPDKTRAAHRSPGVFTLGEVGYVDEDGYVYITDRVSDLVVSGGVNIYPAETEQVLIRHGDVADVACIGIPHPEMGEELRALIVPECAERPPDPAELISFCRQHLAGYKCPKSIEFVPDVERTAMGKVNKKQLRARYWSVPQTTS